MPTPAFKPYADDAASLGIGELTLENGTECVVVYGQLDLTRDKAGLKLARELKAVLDAVVHHLEAAHDLPDQVPPPEPTKTVKNPFSG
jgi:hypothetical protein